MSKVLKAEHERKMPRALHFAGQSYSSPADVVSQNGSVAESQPTRSPDHHTGTHIYGSASHDPTPNSAQSRIASLKLETEVLQRKLDEISSRSDTLQSEAFDRGKQEGLLQSAEENARRHNLLNQALADANSSFAEKSSQVETLALQIAKAALKRVLGKDRQQFRLLKKVIRRQLDRFSDSRPTALRVSAADFPDSAKANRLAGNWPDLRLVIDRNLKAGECHIALELGEVEIGLPGQMARLGSYLDALASEQELLAPSRQLHTANGSEMP